MSTRPLCDKTVYNGLHRALKINSKAIYVRLCKVTNAGLRKVKLNQETEPDNRLENITGAKLNRLCKVPDDRHHESVRDCIK